MKLYSCFSTFMEQTLLPVGYIFDALGTNLHLYRPVAMWYLFLFSFIFCREKSLPTWSLGRGRRVKCGLDTLVLITLSFIFCIQLPHFPLQSLSGPQFKFRFYSHVFMLYGIFQKCNLVLTTERIHEKQMWLFQ